MNSAVNENRSKIKPTTNILPLPVLLDEEVTTSIPTQNSSTPPSGPKYMKINTYTGTHVACC